MPMAEFVLGKQRILEIYLNVVEWGPGIYGAESACRYWDETAARNIGRQPSARLAAILPAPLKRRPERMNSYSALSLSGWNKWDGNPGCEFTNAAAFLCSRAGFWSDGRQPFLYRLGKSSRSSGEPRSPDVVV